MDPGEWMAQFAVAHEANKKGTLSTSAKAQYLQLREELARSLAGAQRLAVPEGQPARRFFRVAQMLPVEVASLYRTMTRDISVAGFSAVVPGSLRESEIVSYALTVQKGADPITGRAKVVSALRNGNQTKCSFALESISETDAERLETALFDAVVARYK
jgi:hypothetical protein